MNADQFDERYKRQLQLPGFGPEAQHMLASAKVLVVGAGGLGVPVLQYLTGMGIGAIGIVDGDNISLSNLHRQVLYTIEDVGLPKVVVAERKLKALNSKVEISSYKAYLNSENAQSLIKAYDIIVDATDNFNARYLINDTCVLLDKPFVYGSVYQYEGHVSVFNFENGPTYRCLYPVRPNPVEIPDCNAAGVLGVVPGIIGCRQALEVVKMISGVGKTLSGSLLIFDFLNDEQYKIKLRLDPQNKNIDSLQDHNHADDKANDIFHLSPHALRSWYENGDSFTLVDVRTAQEYTDDRLAGAVNITLDEIVSGAIFFDEEAKVVLYCQKGSRSAQAARIIRQRHPALRLFDLQGGIDHWNKEFGK